MGEKDSVWFNYIQENGEKGCIHIPNLFKSVEELEVKLAGLSDQIFIKHKMLSRIVDNKVQIAGLEKNIPLRIFDKDGKNADTDMWYLDIFLTDYHNQKDKIDEDRAALLGIMEGIYRYVNINDKAFHEQEVMDLVMELKSRLSPADCNHVWDATTEDYSKCIRCGISYKEVKEPPSGSPKDDLELAQESFKKHIKEQLYEEWLENKPISLYKRLCPQCTTPCEHPDKLKCIEYKCRHCNYRKEASDGNLDEIINKVLEENRAVLDKLGNDPKPDPLTQAPYEHSLLGEDYYDEPKTEPLSYDVHGNHLPQNFWDEKEPSPSYTKKQIAEFWYDQGYGGGEQPYEFENVWGLYGEKEQPTTTPTGVIYSTMLRDYVIRTSEVVSQLRAILKPTEIIIDWQIYFRDALETLLGGLEK